MMQTICGMSRRSAAIGAILTHGMATNSLRLICMTKVLQCDAQARGGGGRRVADDTGHRARLERRDRMGHIRPEATVESVVGVRAHPDR